MRKATLVTLAAATLLAGCGGTKNRGLESVHQPVVKRTDYVYDVGATGLSEAEKTRLDGWFQTLKVGYGDRIAVDGYDAGTRRDVQSIAGRYGLMVDQTAPVTAGEIQSGSVRVVVSRSVAEVPNCPDWSRTSQPEFNQHSMSNFGCAVNSTFAAMVANPEDLIQGRETLAATDAATANKAIGAYRRAVPSGAGGQLKTESTRKGDQ